MWWHRPIISAFGKPRHEDGKFEASFGCIVRPCLEERKERKKIPGGRNF